MGRGSVSPEAPAEITRDGSQKGTEPMSENRPPHHTNERTDRVSLERDDRPYWRRAHHDWRFWIGLILMLVAISIFVLSDDLGFPFLRHR